MKTVSLELAKQLKEAGYPQESSHAYYIDKSDTYLWEKMSYIETSGRQVIDSPTADEILDQLPRWYTIKGNKHGLIVHKSGYAKLPWWVGYESSFEQVEASLCDAAARMWLYLKKEGLL